MSPYPQSPPKIELSINQRLKLIDTLNKLPLFQLLEIEFALNIPDSVMPGLDTEQGMRSAALLGFLKSSKGEDFSPLFDVLEQMGIKPFGVHASLGVFRGDSSSPRRLRVRLKGNFKDQNREKVKALLLEIQWLANNSYGRISSINPESIEIELEGPEDALEGLKRLIDSDELTKISELQIQDALFVKAEVRTKRLNLQFADLTEVRLVGVRLVGARLVGANLTNADLTEANLYGADLTNARLIGARLNQAELTSANLTGTRLTGADLTSANLYKARLNQTDLTSANLTGANLTGADLTKARLIGARLNQAELTSANLTGANLEEARLTNANLSEANLIGANLVSTNYYGANLTRANLKATRLDRANLKETRLRFANLTGANLTVVDLERASLTGAKLIGANLYWANLKGADLEGVDLEGADLEGANLTRANLSRAKLGGANLTEARLDGAIVESATFTANLGLLEQDKTDLSQRGAIFGDVVKMRSSLDYKGVEPADDRIYLLPCLHQSHFIPRRLMS